MAFVGSSSALRVRSRGSSMAKTSVCSQSPFVGRRQSVVSSTTITMRAAPTADLAWVQIVPLSEVEPNKSIARVVAGLDLLVACMEDGQVYCTGNKGTPTGVPLAGGKLIYLNGQPCIKCRQYGTLYNLETGDVEGKWIPGPPVVSNLLRLLFPEPVGIPQYSLRENDGMLEVLVDVNARENFESGYWFGLLDSKGKATGDYY